MMQEKEEEEEGDMSVCVGGIAFSIFVLERAVRACVRVWMERGLLGRVGRSPHWRGGGV